MVSCVIALPIEPTIEAVPQAVKVYDVEASRKTESAIMNAINASGEDKPN